MIFPIKNKLKRFKKPRGKILGSYNGPCWKFQFLANQKQFLNSKHTDQSKPYAVAGIARLGNWELLARTNS